MVASRYPCSDFLASSFLAMVRMSSFTNNFRIADSSILVPAHIVGVMFLYVAWPCIRTLLTGPLTPSVHSMLKKEEVDNQVMKLIMSSAYAQA